MVEQMGLVILNVIDIGNYMKYLNFTICILILTIFNSCETSHKFMYEPLDMNGRRQAGVKKDEKSYHELIKKGSVLYVEFFTYHNYRYPGINVYLYTLEKYDELNIYSFEFEFEGNKKNVEINKKINLNRNMERFSEELIFFVEEKEELSIKTYYYYISHSINNIKIDLHQIFNATDEDVGNDIELTLRMNYSFNDGDIVIQENKYLVSIFKRNK